MDIPYEKRSEKVTLSLHPSLVENLRKDADKNYRSLSREIEVRLIESFKKKAHKS